MLKKMLILFFSFFSTIFLEPGIKKREIIRNGDLNSNKIYLTFDDGYSLCNTEKIFDILQKNKIKATFFFEGDFLNTCTAIVKKIANSDCIIGCHTWSHKDITKMTDYELKCDIIQYEKRYKEITDKNLIKIFRPPMGKINKSKKAILDSLGYTIFTWNVTYVDYNEKYDKGVAHAIKSIVPNVKNGSIILMHTIIKSNVNALEKIILELKNKGFVFELVTDLI